VDLRNLLATEQGLFEIVASHPEHAPVHRSTSEALVPAPDSLNMTAMGLFGLTAYQTARGSLAGNALEHFWSAYGSVRMLRSPALALGFAGLGIYQLVRGQVIGPAASLLYYALTVRHVAGEDGRDVPTTDRNRVTGPDMV